ncbi:MAG: TonB-dependent receptor [Bacteroidota bacterium]
MKKVLFCLVIPMLLPIISLAQFNISGHVSDKNSAAKLSGASIGIEGLFIGTISDDEGNFTIKNLKKGVYKLRITFMGYADLLKTVEVSQNTSVNIEMSKNTILQEEVIISATRTSENQASTFTNINKKQLAELNHGQDLPYLLNTTPALVSSSDAGNGVGYTSLRIRGSDLTRINVTINGIPVNDAESQGVFWVDMPDLASSIDNVQIQRGIGTSTNGSAAFGASINFQTTKLNPKPYAVYDLEYGSFNTWKHSLMAGTGLIENHWAFDVRLSKLNSDGYIERASTDLKSLFFSGGYYGKNTLLKVVVFSGKEKTYQAWNGVPKDSLKTHRRYNPFTYENQTDNYQQDNYQLLFSQGIGKRFLVNAALHYTYGRGYYEEYMSEDDFSKYGLPYPIIGNDTIATTNLIRQKWLNNHFYGFTFSGTYNNHRNLKITLGGAGNKYEGDHYGKIIWAQYASETPINYQWYDNGSLKSEMSLYGKVEYNPIKKITAYLDLQYRTIYFGLDGMDDKLRNITQKHNFSFFNPKIGFNYDITNKHRVYLALALSNREPNGNNFADANPLNPLPKPETMYNAELGYTFNSKYVTTTLNGYYMYYNKQLVLTGAINDVGYAIMTNVAQSYRAGIEICAAARLFKRFTWEMNACFSQNKILGFTEFVDDWDHGGQIENKIGKTNIAFSPTVVASNTFAYNFIENFTISLMTKYVSRQYIDNTTSMDRSLKPYCVSDVVMDYAFKLGIIKEIRVTLMLNNIFNLQYENNAWVYRYYNNGTYNASDGYFPQAGINFLAGLKVRF